MLLDLSADVGDTARAFLNLFPSFRFPTVYFGLAESAGQKGGLKESFAREISAVWLQGKLNDRVAVPTPVNEEALLWQCLR